MQEALSGTKTPKGVDVPVECTPSAPTRIEPSYWMPLCRLTLTSPGPPSTLFTSCSYFTSTPLASQSRRKLRFARNKPELWPSAWASGLNSISPVLLSRKLRSAKPRPPTPRSTATACWKSSSEQPLPTSLRSGPNAQSRAVMPWPWLRSETDFSNIITGMPLSWSRRARLRPAIPAPAIITGFSTLIVTMICSCAILASRFPRCYLGIYDGRKFET